MALILALHRQKKLDHWEEKKGKMSLLHMEIGSVIGAMLRQFNIYHVQ